MNNHSLTWVEISRENLTHNIRSFRELIGPDVILCPAVKANAYGHGLVECAPIILQAGADWLGVNALFEAVKLKESGIKAPIYIMGYIALDELAIAVENGFHFVVYNKETLQKLSEICASMELPAFTHLKIETGNYRQGVSAADLPDILACYKSNPLLQMEGICSHFSNIEDTTDQRYAKFQLQNFTTMDGLIEQAGFNPKYRHLANTAATLIFPEAHFNMVRTGIGNYGLWPSSETMISARESGLKTELKPVLSWKTKIVQVKNVPEGALIGYGCTYKAERPMRLAILPVGYYDNYKRALSNTAYVLIRGKRAPVRGRVCMNITMVDVTNIPDAALQDEVVLLGRQGEEFLSAEQMAKWLHTISYEVTTQINENLIRKIV